MAAIRTQTLGTFGVDRIGYMAYPLDMSSFVPIIERFGTVPDFARAIGMTVGAAKQARRRDSIPAEWFSAVARAASAQGLDGIDEAVLSEIAEQRRLAKLALKEAA